MSDKAVEPRNASARIHISDDLMSAEVDLFPPENGGRGITVVSVIADLEAAGVSWGLEKDGLEKSILKCLTDVKTIRGVPAARGEKAVKAVPSYWHLKKRLLALPEADLKTPNIDYRNRSPYITVKKGEPLAKMIPEAPGKPGRNITGEILPAGVKDIVSFRPGENLLEKDQVLYAGCSGRFQISERVMSVNETLDIAGNVDYSTGHIAFPGDVIIRGAVCDGFRVAAGKSIFVKQTMDASQVLSRGSLVVEGGIKGRGEGLVRVDGGVKAKFIENAAVESHGVIQVEKAVMHSTLNTLDVVDLGEAGVLVGGNVCAREGLRAGHIGRPDSPASVVRVGTDYVVERKITSVRAQIDRLETKLDKLKARHTLNSDQQKLIQQVEEVLKKMNLSEQDLQSRLHPNREALITVAGKVLEGTDLHIAELSLRVSTPLESVIFYYESDGPRIATRDIRTGVKAGGNKAEIEKHDAPKPGTDPGEPENTPDSETGESAGS